MRSQTEASTAGVTMALFLSDPVGAALLCVDQEVTLPPVAAPPPLPVGAGSAAADGPRMLRLVSGRYLLQERVGRGSSGVVFRAEDRWLARQVAVKVFTASGAAGEERRAEREAAVLARLHHPGLVGVLDCGCDRGNRFVVLEFVDGRPLDSLVDGEVLPEAEAVRIAAGVADTLSYVHARGIVHRDVKPANILIDRSGLPKLGDFGVARTSGGPEALPATGCIVGTPRYMAPEQVRGEPLTGAVDVYALGLVLLECLTGSPEYTGAGLECAVARLYRRPSVPDWLPADVSGVVTAMTVGDPLLRPTAAQAAGLLHGLLRRRSAREPAPEPADPAGLLSAEGLPVAAVPAQSGRTAGEPGGFALAGVLGVLLAVGVVAVAGRELLDPGRPVAAPATATPRATVTLRTGGSPTPVTTPVTRSAAPGAIASVAPVAGDVRATIVVARRPAATRTAPVTARRTGMAGTAGVAGTTGRTRRTDRAG